MTSRVCRVRLRFRRGQHRGGPRRAAPAVVTALATTPATTPATAPVPAPATAAFLGTARDGVFQASGFGIPGWRHSPHPRLPLPVSRRSRQRSRGQASRSLLFFRRDRLAAPRRNLGSNRRPSGVREVPPRQHALEDRGGSPGEGQRGGRAAFKRPPPPRFVARARRHRRSCLAATRGYDLRGKLARRGVERRGGRAVAARRRRQRRGHARGGAGRVCSWDETSLLTKKAGTRKGGGVWRLG